MDKIKLASGVVYTIADYATPNSFAVILGNMTDSEVLATLTEKNLSKIQFLANNFAVTGTYYNQLLCGYVDKGDTVEIHINDADLCRYGLVLDDDNRIIDAPFQRYAPDNAVIVDTLPDGDITHYRYVDGEYIYDPLPAPDPVEPEPTTEERIAALEEENAMLLECVLEMSEIVYA